MMDDERVQYMQERLDTRTYQVGWLEGAIKTAVRHLESAHLRGDYSTVPAIVESLKAALSDVEKEAAQYAARAAKLDKPENAKPI